MLVARLFLKIHRASQRFVGVNSSMAETRERNNYWLITSKIKLGFDNSKGDGTPTYDNSLH